MTTSFFLPGWESSVAAVRHIWHHQHLGGSGHAAVARNKQETYA